MYRFVYVYLFRLSIASKSVIIYAFCLLENPENISYKEIKIIVSSSPPSFLTYMVYMHMTHKKGVMDNTILGSNAKKIKMKQERQRTNTVTI